MSTHIHTPQPFALVRGGAIIGYAWSRELAEQALTSYACAHWVKGASVVPNPSVSIGAAIAPRRRGF